MAKAPQQVETQTPETGTETQTSQTSSTETSGTENTQTGGSKPPSQTKEEVASAEDRANQNQFIAEFDNDDVVEEEGAPVQTAGKATPAQSGEVSDSEPELDASGKPKVKQVPPADTSGDLQEAEEGDDKTPQQPEKKKPAAEVQETPPVVQTPEQVAERYGTWRKETENVLATQHYALKPEEIEELDTNPGEFLSRKMAKVYLDAVTATLTQVTQFLPRMIQDVNQQSVQSNQNEEQFFQRWPKLKEHQQAVLRTAAVYRQLNPSASMEDFINEVGAQTMVALRIPPEEQQQQVNGKGNGVPVRTAPFKPAASSPPGGASPPQQKNLFDQLNDEFEEELDDN